MYNTIPKYAIVYVCWLYIEVFEKLREGAEGDGIVYAQIKKKKKWNHDNENENAEFYFTFFLKNSSKVLTMEDESGTTNSS